MLLAPGLCSCWEYTGSIKETCRLVVSPAPRRSLQQTLNSTALGSWGAAGQQGLLRPGTPYAGAPLLHHAWHCHNAAGGLAIPSLPVRLDQPSPSTVPRAVADLGQVPLSLSFPIRNTSLVNKDPAKMPEPRPGSQKQGVAAWTGEGEKSMRGRERGLRRWQERRQGARDARYLGVACPGSRVRLGG